MPKRFRGNSITKTEKGDDAHQARLNAKKAVREVADDYEVQITDLRVTITVKKGSKWHATATAKVVDCG